MSDMHSFSVDVAEEVGVNAAILLQSIKWWCQKNKANGKNEHDGLWWTYNSIKAWQELYPYLGKSAINTALKKLEDRGFIKTGNYNKSAYDRTIWYAITDKGLSLFGECISENRQMDESENVNGVSENDEPIPVTEQLLTESVTSMGAAGPTREEVRAYVKAKGYHFDPDYFYDYYEASNWHLQGGKKITKWKQCCVTWEQHSGRYGRPTNRPKYNEFGHNSKTAAEVFGEQYA